MNETLFSIISPIYKGEKIIVSFQTDTKEGLFGNTRTKFVCLKAFSNEYYSIPFFIGQQLFFAKSNFRHF